MRVVPHGYFLTGITFQTVDESPDMADASQDSGAAARKPIKKVRI